MQRAVERYLQHLAVERGLAANTLSAYRRDLARYVRFLTEVGDGAQAPPVDDPREITVAHVTGFVRWLQRPAPPKEAADGGADGAGLSARSAARVVVAVRPEDEKAVDEACGRHGVTVTGIGDGPLWCARRDSNPKPSDP